MYAAAPPRHFPFGSHASRRLFDWWRHLVKHVTPNTFDLSRDRFKFRVDRNGPRSQKLSELEARRSNAIAAHGSRNEDVSRRNRGGDNNSPSSSRDASGFVSCRGVNFGGGCVDSVSASSSFTSGARSCSSTVAGNHGSHEFDSSEGRYDARAISEIDQNGTVEGCSRGRAHRMGVASTIMTRNENNHHGNGEMGEDYHPRTLAESPAVSGSVPPAGDMYCRDERGRPIRKRKLSVSFFGGVVGS